MFVKLVSYAAYKYVGLICLLYFPPLPSTLSLPLPSLSVLLIWNGPLSPTATKHHGCLHASFLVWVLGHFRGGYLFGLPVGFVADSIGATLGATPAFLLNRMIGRSYVISKLKKYPEFQAVAISTQRYGFKIVLLLWLVP